MKDQIRTAGTSGRPSDIGCNKAKALMSPFIDSMTRTREIEGFEAHLSGFLWILRWIPAYDYHTKGYRVTSHERGLASKSGHRTRSSRLPFQRLRASARRCCCLALCSKTLRRIEKLRYPYPHRLELRQQNPYSRGLIGGHRISCRCCMWRFLSV